MAKTNPIGVRFDKDMLNCMEEDGIADSPQKALNFLSEFWNTKREKINFAEKFAGSKLFNANKSTNLVEPKVEKEDNPNDAIEAQIKAIQAEKIPEHRNTTMGKKAWAIEQNNRIKELLKQLK